MTNTTELRNRFDSEVNKWLDPMSDYGGKELVDFLICEIEQAEKAKVEEVIAYVENAPHRVKGYEYGEKLCKDTRNRFLTKHDDEN